MIKILGRANSINVQKVMWCAAELGITSERLDIGGPYGGNDTVEYISKNPNGTIPTIIDGKFSLWESNTIVRYFCERWGTASWFPKTIEDRAHASQWMDWYLTTLHLHMTVIFWQLIRTPIETQDKNAIETARLEAIKLWGILDHHLEKKTFVIGENITMADIPLGCAAYRWHSLEITRPKLKHLDEWWKRLCQRDAYKKHVMLPLT